MGNIELYKKRIERERLARKQAENILEKKTLELFKAKEHLQKLYKTKDELLEAISKALIVLFKEEDFESALQESINIVGNTIEVDRFSIATVDEGVDKFTLVQNFEHANKEFDSLFHLLMEQNNLDKLFYRFAKKFLKGKKLVKFNSSQRQHRLVLKAMELIGLSSVVLMPIDYQGKIRAIISIELLDIEYDWSENDEAILLAFASGVESIIEKFETRRKLEDQRSFYESVLNSIPSDLVVFDKDHRYKFVNPVAVKNPEIRNWLIDKDDFEYVEYRNKPKKIAENRRAVFNKVVETKEALNFEEKHINIEGKTEWKLRNLFPVFNEKEDLEMMIGYALDITNIKKTNLELNTTSTRLSTLISSLNSGILLEDKNRRILVTNEEFCSIFGILAKPSDLVGIDCSGSAEQSKHLIKDPEKFVLDVYQIVQERKIITDEEIHFVDGRVFERDFIPIYLEEEYLGHLWEYRDVTEKKEAEKELIRAREEAEESRRLKQKFLANMSHEIRTPMNGVVGIVHFLERTSLDDTQKNYLNILKDSSEHLLHIINDILDVSKLEEGKLILSETPVQFDSIIEGVLQNVKSRADDKNLDIKVIGLDIFDSPLLTDPVRVRQILLNLLSNAIKFTHKGSIGIDCTTISKTKNHHTFNLKVWDTGIGIPEESRDKIFAAFDQSSLNTTTLYGGTGLGLNIVKELVEKLEGDIEVESELNKGSSFNITLSLSTVEIETAIFDDFQSLSEQSEHLNGKNILVVDDHHVNFDIANEMLSTWGASVEYAENGKRAIEELQEKKIDLILMDMQMPVMDGIEATLYIRSLNSDKSKVPIIAMTAATLPEEREKCLQSGMNDYISKPYNPSILIEIISSQLGIESDLIETTTEASDSIKTARLYDLTYLKDLSGNNEPFILEMINSFQNDMPELMEEMLLSFSDKNLNKLGIAAHKAKSMASYLGTNKIREHIVNIENLLDSDGDSDAIQYELELSESLLKKVIKELKEFEL
jgi:signal transduction histidine kinase/FixJ family two-component response regulator